MKLAVTGADGFIGCKLRTSLQNNQFSVIQVTRRSSIPNLAEVHEIHQATNWSNLLSQEVGVVIHLAAQVPDSFAGPVALSQYREINTLGTVNLARQCAEHGVKRFIFMSTAKVLGEGRNSPYRDNDTPCPQDAYAISKWKAEQGLWQIAQELGMEVVILRAPLVYGPGVKGNLRRLMELIQSGVPLPLGSVSNRRSMIGLDNLVDLIIQCITDPRAAGQTFLASDGEDCSTPQLLRLIAASMGRSARLFPVPSALLRLLGQTIGKSAEMDRLLDSFVVDSSRVRELLGWKPKVDLEQGLEQMVRAWMQKELK